MRVAFAKKKLERLYLEGIGSKDFPEAVYLSFVDAIRILILAPDERMLNQIPGLRPEKLEGKRRFEKSIRLNKQFRLIYRIEQDKEGNFCLVIDLEDYH